MQKYTYNLYIPHNSSVTCMNFRTLIQCHAEPLSHILKNSRRKYSAKPYEGMRAMNNDTEKGYLKISVTEAGGTIPIKGALVVITEYGDDDGESGNVLYSLTTDNGGYTPTVALEAPVKSESMMPGAYQP